MRVTAGSGVWTMQWVWQAPKSDFAVQTLGSPDPAGPAAAGDCSFNLECPKPFVDPSISYVIQNNN
jgi:hypothetical protein